MHASGRREGLQVATPLSEKSEEYQRVLYLLQMSTRHLSLSDVCVWQFGSSSQTVQFERTTRNMQTLPAWVSTRRLGEENSLETLHHKGFTIDPKTGLTLSCGEMDIDPNESTAQRFLLCQVGVGRAFVVDDPSEQTTMPEGYDSLYLALSIGEEEESYRHEYTVMNAAQVLPMYLVQFFIDADGRGSDIDFAAANRMDDFGDTSIDKIYDRYDFFDPILYTPVSIRDKMVGSHSSGELAQHKLIGIGDAYESAVSESMKVDPIVASRQEEIRLQLQAIDTKLREVNRNSATVEEKIYKTLQEALFRLQDITQSKMSALLSEEVELRRQLQQLEWMEGFLDQQRETASQVEFLNSWKCHVQLRADSVRAPLRTPMILSHIHADLDLIGGVQIISKSAAARGIQAPPASQAPASLSSPPAPPTYSSQRPQESQRSTPVLNGHPPSTTSLVAQPPQMEESQSEAKSTLSEVPGETKETELLRKMFSQVSSSSLLSSVAESASRPSSARFSQPPVSRPEGVPKLAKVPDNLQFAMISQKTPPQYAQFSLQAEAIRRIRFMKLTPEESLHQAEMAFEDSKILQHPNVEVEMQTIRKEQEELEEESSSEDEDTKANKKRKGGKLQKKSPPPQKIPRIFCDAQAILLALPFPRGSREPPTTRLLYASWKPGADRSVKGIVQAMPRTLVEYDDEDNEDDEKAGGPKYDLEEVPTVLIIRANGHVFGGYADSPWRSDGQTFGTSRCFLFSSTLDIKIPFQGRKVLEPPPRPTELDDEISDPGFTDPHPTYAALKSSETVLQFGVRDLVLRDDLSACTSELEFTFGVGLPTGAPEAASLLAGSAAFRVDEVELWAVDSQ